MTTAETKENYPENIKSWSGKNNFFFAEVLTREIWKKNGQINRGGSLAVRFPPKVGRLKIVAKPTLIWMLDEIIRGPYLSGCDLPSGKMKLVSSVLMLSLEILALLINEEIETHTHHQPSLKSN